MLDASAVPVPGSLPQGTDLDGFLEALHTAIRLEEEGLQFYTLNASRVRNPRGRAAFHLLVRDERQQLVKLRAQLQGIQEALRGTPDEGRAGAVPARESTLNPIFSRGRTLAERDCDDREVLRLAIAIGWDALGFFRERAEAARDPWCRLMYDDLALESKRRYEALVEAYETIVGARADAAGAATSSASAASPRSRS